jgi:cob(I)alamin adenosyltransferase
VTRIYTRTGDEGSTGYLGPGRISKNDPRIHALGCLDEVNSALGVVRSHPATPAELRPALDRLQNGLFEAGTAIASDDPKRSAAFLSSETAWLEERIDEWEGELAPLRRFVLPGGSPPAAGLHWARSIARRAERAVVAAFGVKSERKALLAYVNRLSDALFVLARTANRIVGVEETPWDSTAGKE